MYEHESVHVILHIPSPSGQIMIVDKKQFSHFKSNEDANDALITPHVV